MWSFRGQSWRFIEQRFRSKEGFQFIRRRTQRNLVQIEKPSPFAFVLEGKQDAHGRISLVATH